MFPPIPTARGREHEGTARGSQKSKESCGFHGREQAGTSGNIVPGRSREQAGTRLYRAVPLCSRGEACARAFPRALTKSRSRHRSTPRDVPRAPWRNTRLGLPPRGRLMIETGTHRDGPGHLSRNVPQDRAKGGLAPAPDMPRNRAARVADASPLPRRTLASSAKAQGRSTAVLESLRPSAARGRPLICRARNMSESPYFPPSKRGVSGRFAAPMRPPLAVYLGKAATRRGCPLIRNQ